MAEVETPSAVMTAGLAETVTVEGG